MTLPAFPALLALCLSLALTAPTARAQELVTAAEPGKILEIARGFGSAELEAQDDGSPLITGRMDGKRYSLFFYGCTDGRDCGSIQFWTYFAAPKDALAAVNDWNRNYRFGRAYIDDDGDIALEYDVNLWGGVTTKNLDDTFDWWARVMEKARETFAEPGLGPSLPPSQTDGTTL